MHRLSSLLASLCLVAPSLAGAQIVATPLTRGSANTYQYSYEHAWTSLLSNPQVQRELELVPKQMERLKELQNQYREDYRKAYQALREPKQPFDDLARAELAERTAEIKETLVKGLTECLLPHQLERAKQVAFQQRLKSGGYAFRDPGIMDLLGIDAEQAERMQKRANELRNEAAQEYRRLLAEANDKLLEELTPEQMVKLKRLSGDKYDPPPFDWRAYYEQQRNSAPKPETE